MKILFLFRWLHRPSQFCSQLNLEWWVYFEHKVQCHRNTSLYWHLFLITSLAIYCPNIRYPIKKNDHIRHIPYIVPVQELTFLYSEGSSLLYGKFSHIADEMILIPFFAQSIGYRKRQIVVVCFM